MDCRQNDLFISNTAEIILTLNLQTAVFAIEDLCIHPEVVRALRDAVASNKFRSADALDSPILDSVSFASRCDIVPLMLYLVVERHQGHSRSRMGPWFKLEIGSAYLNKPSTAILGTIQIQTRLTHCSLLALTNRPMPSNHGLRGVFRGVSGMSLLRHLNCMAFSNLKCGI